MIELRYFLWWCWHKKTEPAPVITSTFAHAAWHPSHSTCRISLAGLYAFAATRLRWPSPKIPIASPSLVNTVLASRRSLSYSTPGDRDGKGDTGSAEIGARYNRCLDQGNRPDLCHDSCHRLAYVGRGMD